MLNSLHILKSDVCLKYFSMILYENEVMRRVNRFQVGDIERIRLEVTIEVINIHDGDSKYIYGELTILPIYFRWIVSKFEPAKMALLQNKTHEKKNTHIHTHVGCQSVWANEWAKIKEIEHKLVHASHHNNNGEHSEVQWKMEFKLIFNAVWKWVRSI